ncbi:hypothetical protein [Streptomyces tauricus]|uniref:hypothetical protein n=1 Tax=Streptomyces tauricus TaxID=68274 RepID=UPI0033A75381
MSLLSVCTGEGGRIRHTTGDAGPLRNGGPVTPIGSEAGEADTDKGRPPGLEKPGAAWY